MIFNTRKKEERCVDAKIGLPLSFAHSFVAELSLWSKIPKLKKRRAEHSSWYQPETDQKLNSCSSVLYSGSHGKYYCIESVDCNNYKTEHRNSIRKLVK